ncbi:unnamed protein product [Cunninghamella echinulata]
MMPMAVIYLLGRTIIDLSRGSIYLILYQGEKSIPIIDAWLFDKVTVWLPNKYEQLQQWWATRGKKICQKWQTHLIHVTIPNAIDKIDQGIEQLYHVGQALQEMSTTIHQAWKKFRQQHDWQQLMIDIGYTFYIHLWQPWFSIMVRIANITILLFKGVRQGIISTWHDLQWLVLQMVPNMLTWIKSTQVWQSGHHTLHQIYLFTHYCLHVVFLPVLQWCGQSLHYLFIDLLLQQWLLSDSARYYYKKVQQNITNFHVWFCTDMVLFFNGIKWFCVMMVDDGLLPLCQAFQHHVIPQLSKVYYFLKSDMFLVYHTYVYPIWEIAVTWVQQYLPTIYHCLEHSYHSFITFFTTFEWKWETMIDITSQFILFNQKIFTVLLQSMSYVFSQQIPLVLKTFQTTWHHFIHDIDWQKILLTLEQMHQMIIDQCLIMVTSLERTLNEWASMFLK